MKFKVHVATVIGTQMKINIKIALWEYFSAADWNPLLWRRNCAIIIKQSNKGVTDLLRSKEQTAPGPAARRLQQVPGAGSCSPTTNMDALEFRVGVCLPMLRAAKLLPHKMRGIRSWRRWESPGSDTGRKDCRKGKCTFSP